MPQLPFRLFRFSPYILDVDENFSHDNSDALAIFTAVQQAAPRFEFLRQRVLLVPAAYAAVKAADDDPEGHAASDILYRETKWALLSPAMVARYFAHTTNLRGLGERIPALSPPHADCRRVRTLLKLTAVRAGLPPNCVWMEASRAEAGGRAVLGTVAAGTHVLALVPEVPLQLLPPALGFAFEAADVLHRAGCASPVWVLAAVAALAGLAPTQPAVQAGSHAWHNATHFAPAARARLRPDMAVTERIPLTWRGLPFSAEGGLALRAAMLRRGLAAPHWLPTVGMAAVFGGLAPVEGAHRCTVDGLEVVHVSDTRGPLPFDAARYERHSVRLVGVDGHTRLSPSRHAHFLARHGLRADDATTRSWVSPALLQRVDPDAAAAASAAAASGAVRTAAHDGQPWVNAHDAQSSALWHVLLYRPVFVPSSAAVQRRQHVVLALHAHAVGSRSVLWAGAGHADERRHAVVGSLAVDGRILMLLEPREGGGIECAASAEGRKIPVMVGDVGN
jgi:hypothetical protein